MTEEATKPVTRDPAVTTPDEPSAALDGPEARAFSDQMLNSRIMLPCLAEGCDWAMVIGSVLVDVPALPADPAGATFFLECIRYGKSRRHVWSGFASLEEAKCYARATPDQRAIHDAERRVRTA